MKERYFDPKLKIFSLSSNRPLAEKIAAYVGVELESFPWTVLVTAKFKLTLKRVFGAITST